MAMHTKFRRRMVGSILSALVSAASAQAIDINITIDNPQNFPDYDPQGQGLKAIAQAATQIWQELRPGNGTYNINLHWEAFGLGNELGIANGFDGSIRINSDYSWFIDSTPLQNEEFGNFTQKFYRDIDGVDKDDWFDGPVPDMLEYSYSAVAFGNGPAAGKYDLLTVVLHEVGHLTGISYNLFAPDVNLDPDWIGMNTGAVVHRRNEAHIDPEGSLMDPDTAASTRGLPSALDVMVNAHEKGDSDVNLQRIEYIGNELIPQNFFNDPLSWIGGKFPGLGEQATIRNYQDVMQFGVDDIDLLRVTEYADLTIMAGSINVTGELKVDYEGEVDVEAGTTLTANQLDVNFQGVVKLNGGNVDGNYVTTRDTGIIQGFGTLTIEKELDNQAYIEGKGGVLNIHGVSLSSIDLDGSNDNGWLIAETGSINVDRFLDDDFSGKMRIAEGQFIHFDYYLNLDDQSTLEFKSDVNGGVARLTGPSDNSISIEGEVDVLPETTAEIRAERINISYLDPTDSLNVWYDSSLSLKGEIHYYVINGKIEGEGILHQDGNAEVVGSMKIDTETYNWDGNDESAPTNMLIKQNSSLTINSKSIEANDAGYDGKVTLETGASLKVNSTGNFIPGWKLDAGGQINLTANTVVDGTQINSAGTISADKGSSTIKSDLNLLAGSDINLSSKTTLNLKGTMVTYDGGNITGPKGMFDESMLQQFSSARVIEHSTIEIGYFNWDPSEKDHAITVIEHTGQLSIIAGKIGTYVDLGDDTDEGFGDQIDINSGVLEVLVGSDAGVDLPNYWTLRKEGVMNLNLTYHSPPSVLGSHLINEGLIQGSGQFFNVLTNDGSLIIGKDQGIGLIELFNTFDQTKNGLLGIELAGGIAGAFDSIRTNSEFDLNGTLTVSLLSNFDPQIGQVFRIIDGTNGGKRIGEFSDVVFTMGGEWDVIYGDDYVDLRFTAVPEASTLVFMGLGLTLLVGRVAVRRYATTN